MEHTSQRNKHQTALLLNDEIETLHMEEIAFIPRVHR